MACRWHVTGLSSARIHEPEIDPDAMRSTRKPLAALSVLAFAACASSAGPAPDPASPDGTPPPAATVDERPRALAPTDGAAATFSEAQADRGRDTFRATCTECHHSGEFTDARFKYRWSGRSAGNLYQLIQTSMPETAPGSLRREQAVELVSYILRMNGFQPGAGELTSDRAVLDGISLAPIRDN
jgi:cytochrome c5